MDIIWLNRSYLSREKDPFDWRLIISLTCGSTSRDMSMGNLANTCRFFRELGHCLFIPDSCSSCQDSLTIRILTDEKLQKEELRKKVIETRPNNKQLVRSLSSGNRRLVLW